MARASSRHDTRSTIRAPLPNLSATLRPINTGLAKAPASDTTTEAMTILDSWPFNASAEPGADDLAYGNGNNDRRRQASRKPSSTFLAAAVQLSSPWRRPERANEPRQGQNKHLRLGANSLEENLQNAGPRGNNAEAATFQNTKPVRTEFAG